MILPPLKTITVLATLLLCQLVNAQKLIIVSKINDGWSITKSASPPYLDTPSPLPDWITNKTTSLLNTDWTYNVKEANLANSQTNMPNKIGNQSQPLWITDDNCVYHDNTAITNVYYFRKPFKMPDCSKVKKAFLRFTSDNYSRVYLNGAQVFNLTGPLNIPSLSIDCKVDCGRATNYQVNGDGLKGLSSNSWQSVFNADVTDLITNGDNILAVEGINFAGCDYNYGWILINLEIDYSNTIINEKNSLVTSANCRNRGKIEFEAEGGNLPYLYSINNSSNQSSGNFDNLSAGNYTIRATDSNGCIFEKSFKVDSIKNNISIVIDSLDNKITCTSPETAIKFHAVSNPYPAKLTLDGIPVVLQGRKDNLTIGRHYLIAIDSLGCTTDTVVFDVTEVIGTEYNEYNRSICEGDSTLFNEQFLNTSGTYRDTIINKLNNCISINTLNLIINPKIILQLDFQICEGDKVKIGPDRFISKSEVINYSGSSGCDSTVHYTVSYLDPILCLRTGCNVYIPNVFSPNNDGVNDEFKAETYNAIVTEMFIFDRWGEQLFHQVQVDPKWNGIFHSKGMNPATFVYVIKGHCLDGTPFYRKGDVTIIK